MFKVISKATIRKQARATIDLTKWWNSQKSHRGERWEDTGAATYIGWPTQLPRSGTRPKPTCPNVNRRTYWQKHNGVNQARNHLYLYFSSQIPGFYEYGEGGINIIISHGVGESGRGRESYKLDPQNTRSVPVLIYMWRHQQSEKFSTNGYWMVNW